MEGPDDQATDPYSDPGAKETTDHGTFDLLGPDSTSSEKPVENPDDETVTQRLDTADQAKWVCITGTSGGPSRLPQLFKGDQLVTDADIERFIIEVRAEVEAERLKKEELLKRQDDTQILSITKDASGEAVEKTPTVLRFPTPSPEPLAATPLMAADRNLSAKVIWTPTDEERPKNPGRNVRTVSRRALAEQLEIWVSALDEVKPQHPEFEDEDEDDRVAKLSNASEASEAEDALKKRIMEYPRSIRRYLHDLLDAPSESQYSALLGARLFFSKKHLTVKDFTDARLQFHLHDNFMERVFEPETQAVLSAVTSLQVRLIGKGLSFVADEEGFVHLEFVDAIERVHDAMAQLSSRQEQMPLLQPGEVISKKRERLETEMGIDPEGTLEEQEILAFAELHDRIEAFKNRILTDDVSGFDGESAKELIMEQAALINHALYHLSTYVLPSLKMFATQTIPDPEAPIQFRPMDLRTNKDIPQAREAALETLDHSLVALIQCLRTATSLKDLMSIIIYRKDLFEDPIDQVQPQQS